LAINAPLEEPFQEEIEFSDIDRGANKSQSKKEKPSLKKYLEEIKNVLENIRSYLT
jgi:hypothetical protein